MVDIYTKLDIINIDGTQYSLEKVYKATSVPNFKRMVGVTLRCTSAASCEALQLLYMGEELDNSRTLESYGLEDDSIVRVIPGTPVMPSNIATDLGTPNGNGTVHHTIERRGEKIGDAFARDGSRSYLLEALTMDMTAEDVLDLVSEKTGVDKDYLMIIYGAKQLKEGSGCSICSSSQLSHETNRYRYRPNS